METSMQSSVITARNVEKVYQQERGTTIIIVTHDPRIGSQMQRVIRVRDGLLEETL